MMRAESRRFGRGVRLSALVVLATILDLALPPAYADDSGPQNAVRRFCAADAMGARMVAGQWRGVGELVAWPFDPAWDRVVSITGYRIGATEALDDGQVKVEVDYAVVGETTATGFEPGAHVERLTFVLDSAGDNDWRIVAPLLPPHVFGHRLQIEEVVDSLKHGRSAFVSSSLFVQQLLQAAGWDVPHVATAALLGESTYGSVSSPAKGDLIVYVQEGVPYHVGLLEAPNRVISSTLNAGIVRTTPNAFLGEVRYLRLMAPAKAPTATPIPTPPAS